MPNTNATPELFKCYGCDEYKPASEYWVYNGKKTKRPVQPRCKDCSRKRNREISYPKYKDGEKYKEKARARHRRYAHKNPEKLKSHQLVRRRGLKKPACERCGLTGKLQMHHHDYSKPLEVITLCISCHRATHKEKATA